MSNEKKPDARKLEDEIFSRMAKVVQPMAPDPAEVPPIVEELSRKLGISSSELIASFPSREEEIRQEMAETGCTYEVADARLHAMLR